MINATAMGRLEQTKNNAGARSEYLNEQGMIFGSAYHSSGAVVPDGTDAPVVANPVTDYTPSARPGGLALDLGAILDGRDLVKHHVQRGRESLVHNGRFVARRAASRAPQSPPVASADGW